jgi:hypothetical protein
MRKLKSDMRRVRILKRSHLSLDGQRPAPVRPIAPGLLILPVMSSDAVHSPFALGENQIATLQLLSAAIDPPAWQVVLGASIPNPQAGGPWPAPSPQHPTGAVSDPSCMLEIVIAALFFLGFDTVTNLTPLTVFTLRVGNLSSSLFGE